MNQRWLARRAQRPTLAVKRKRVRANKYGRRGPGNGCGHDRRNYIRPTIARNLPPFVYQVIEAFEAMARQGRLPNHLNFRFASRSERDEAVRALVVVMVANTCILSQRIGRPSKREPGTFEGLTVDHHLAPMSGVAESRIERAISTLKDWAWLHFKVGKDGRRRSAQPVEVKEDGKYQGLAAIHVWAPEFWRGIGISRTALKAAQQKYEEDRARRSAKPVAVEPLFEQLAAAIWDPTSKPRPPP